jgi:hypothetical protein
MTRWLLAFLLLPGLAVAQPSRSGPNAPAVNSQLPPSDPPRDLGNAPQAAPGDPNARTGANDARTAPPADHRVLGGPAVPGAAPPQSSEGFVTNRDRVPERPAARPDASTTGR